MAEIETTGNLSLKSIETIINTGDGFDVEGEACIVICLGGNAIQKVGDFTSRITSGDVRVLFPGMKYEYINTENFRVCLIKFSYETLLIEAESFKNSEGFQLLFIYESYLASGGELSANYSLSREMLKNLEPLLMLLEEELVAQKDEYEIAAKHMFLSIVAIISRYSTKKKRLPGGSGVEVITGVASYMETNYADSIKLEDLAALTHYSCRHFTRLFHEHFHTSPMTYLNNIRMYKANNMIMKTSLSIEEIAHRIGFEDSGHFCRQFKRHYGLTPKQCRKKNTG